jgi:hypothetical protein
MHLTSSALQENPEGRRRCRPVAPVYSAHSGTNDAVWVPKTITCLFVDTCKVNVINPCLYFKDIQLKVETYPVDKIAGPTPLTLKIRAETGI